MRHASRLIASLLPALLATGCASTGSVPELATTYRSEVGRASRIQIDDHVPRILDRHQYAIERLEDDRANTYYLQTRWMWREPFADEAEMGYTQANSRIIIEARRVAENAWRVRLRAENRLRRPDSTNWEEAAITKMCKDHFDEIVRDLKNEFESRFR